jgi:surfeit locus 1 family protein
MVSRSTVKEASNRGTMNQAQLLGYDLLAFQLELSPDMPNGYVRHWNISTLISPEKHLAYALQWFGLALVLTVMFIKMALKK